MFIGASRTWVHPLHAIREAIFLCRLVVVHSERTIGHSWVRRRQSPVGVDIIPSPWRVDENGMCCGERPSRGQENKLGKTKHSGGQTETLLRCGCSSVLQCSDPLAVGVYNLMVVDADRQRAVAGAISTYGYGLGLDCLVRPSRCSQVLAKGTIQSNEQCKWGPPAGPAIACQPSKH